MLKSFFKEALENTRPASPLEFAAVNYLPGKLMVQSGHCKEAFDFLQSALDADRNSEFKDGIADDLYTLGGLCLNQGKAKDAAEFYKRSVKMYALMGYNKKVNEITDLIEKISKNTKIDTTRTKHFVERWIAGEISIFAIIFIIF